MASEHLVAVHERAREALGQIDGTMLASSAADRDGEVIAIVARVIGQPAGDEMMDVGVHPLDFRMPTRRFGHRWQLVLSTAEPETRGEEAPSWAAREELAVESRSIVLLRRIA